MNTIVSHQFEPIFNIDSKILILGTMPSPKSREIGFYYSHPRNRFWRVLSAVLVQNEPASVDEKKLFLFKNKIALWDVLASCRIKNASDSTISEPTVNDFSRIFEASCIQAIFTTGKKATSIYEQHCDGHWKPIYLPSTSPANCAVSLTELIKAYSVILDYL